MSPQADALARTFRRAQITTSIKSAALVRALWERTIQPGNIQESSTKWMALAVPIILRYREDSAASGEAYYRAMRLLALPDAEPLVPVKVDLLSRENLEKSLWKMGPEKLIKARALIPEDQDPIVDVKMAADKAADLLEHTAIRHTQNGGRATIDQIRQADKVAVGYYRETDGDPCYFCGMLASRGVVYKEDSFDESDVRFEGDGKCKVHDSCACHNRPSFVKGDKFPGITKDMQDLWLSIPTTYRGRPVTNNNIINAFRHLYAEKYSNKS